MKKFIYLSLSLFLLASCGQYSSEYKKLQKENEELRLENSKITSEMDESLALINEISEEFDRIRTAENYVNMQTNASGEVSKSARQKISEDMALISEVLSKNKEQIEKLKNQLKNSSLRSTQLEKTVERLSAELDEKVALIADLQEQLAKKNIAIAALDQAVHSLSRDVSDLSKETKTQQTVINIQEKELNAAYYCFGTTRELKDQNIVSGRTVLPTGFNKDYFMEIDIRKVKEIPLYAKKAKLLTTHPSNSYELVKDENKKMVLKINDINNFWSVSRYLVLEVNL